MKIFALFILFFPLICFSQKKSTEKPENKSAIEESIISALRFRMVGPALTSGRVVDIAIHPSNNDKWFVAAASGGVWLTNNHGITFTPIFENYGSYSITDCP